MTNKHKLHINKTKQKNKNVTNIQNTNIINTYKLIATLLSITLSLFLITQCFAEPTEKEYNKYEYLKLEILSNINFGLTLDSNFKVDEFNVFSNFFPKTINGSQYLNSVEMSHKEYELIPETSSEYDKYKLKYIYSQNQLRNNNNIKSLFVIEKTIHRPEIYAPVEYPIKKINTADMKYLEFEGLIDTTPTMKNEVSKIVEGKTEVYEISLAIADWIQKYVEYDLGTLAQNPNQKASEVFVSKKGVCKEITILFTSMMRSIGIPTRIVTGIAFTNDESVINYVGNEWGGHAWAEVLIGDTWVPFDLTYEEYGYVDASHIILDRAQNLSIGGVSISAVSNGIKIVENSLLTDYSVQVLDKREKITSDKASVLIDGIREMGFGSFGYINISLENKDNFYKVIDLKINKVAEIQELNTIEPFLVGPFEKKEIYYKYKVPEMKERGYIYTYPFYITINNEKNVEYNISVSEEFLKFNLESLPRAKEIEKKYSDNELQMECLGRNYIVNNRISCEIRNPNNYKIDNVYICYQNFCEIKNLSIYETSRINFNVGNVEYATIMYSYGNEKKYVPVEMGKPDFNYSYYLEENIMHMNLSILNYFEGQKIIVLDNGFVINEVSQENSNLEMELVPGKHEIKLELYYEEIKYGEKTLEFRVKSSGFFGFFKNVWVEILELF